MSRAECWVHGALRAALCAARVFGMAPIRIEKRARRADRIAVSAACVVYGKVINVVIAALAIIAAGRFTYAAIMIHGSDFSRSSIWYLTLIIEICATSLVVCVASVNGLQRMGRFISIIKEIQTINFNNNIKKFTKDSFRERWVWLLIVWGFALHLFSLILAVFAFKGNMEAVMLFAFMYMPNLCKIFIILEYICLISVLNSSLMALNNSLNEIGVELSLKEDYDNTVYKKAYETVKGVHYSYVSMYGIVMKLNKQDGVLLFILISATVIKTIRSIYLILPALNIQATFSLSDKITFVIEIGWFVYEIAKTVILFEICYRTTEMLNSMRYVVGECFVNASPGGVLAKELTTFQETFEITPLSFAPLDICTLSRSVMFAILSFYVTVAAVMRQFNLKE